MEQIHHITEVRFEGEYIIIKVDGLLLKLKVSEISNRLSLATDEEKKAYSISPSGYGIHWPKIDEDISINSLMHKQKA